MTAEAEDHVPDVTVLVKCPGCLTYKPSTEFYVGGGRRFSRCKPCYIEIQTTRATSFREWIHALKLATGCMDCGYNKNAYALQYDHIAERGPKKFNIATGGTRSRQKVIEELAKCDLVCATCHAVRTSDRQIALMRLRDAA